MNETCHVVQSAPGDKQPYGKNNPVLTFMQVHMPRILILIIASYGLLYFSYHFETPFLGTNDYLVYYRIYQFPLNLHVAPAPTVCRQISAIATYLVLKSGLYYPNNIQFQDARYDQHVFFAALFTNWVFLLLTAWLAGLIAEHELGERNHLAALIAGFLCFLAFETQVSVITGLTEGPSWFLLAAGFLAYLRRARFPLFMVLILSIFQRETIIVALGLIAVFDLLLTGKEKRFRLQVSVCAAICFVAYILARRFFIPGSENQTHMGALISELAHFQITKALVFQGFLSQNTLGIYLAAVISARCRAGIRLVWVPVLLGTTVVIDIMGLAAGIGQNIGRISSILTPVFAGLAASVLWKIWDRHDSNRWARAEIEPITLWEPQSRDTER
jgi:hypothetical protein